MASFEARVSSKGQLTIPAELRRDWNLQEGDLVEFTRLADGRVMVRPRNLPVTALFGLLSHLKADPAYASDDEAIAAQVVMDDEATMTVRKRSRAA